MESIVCNGCSLLCDDVSAEVTGKTVNSLGLCKLGHAHLETVVMHKTRSAETDFQKATKILLNAKNLLIYGWTHATNQDIKEGVKLAKTLNGYFGSIIDIGPKQVMSHSLNTQGLGIDLEYVRNNGEFIIYWGSDPSESLHRHPSRFAVLPRGEKIPEGIESRTIGVVDIRQTETMKMANHRLVIPIGKDAELLNKIISELEGKSVIKDKVLGISGSEFLGFVKAFQKSDCTVIFYGGGLINSGNQDANLTGLAKLVEVLRSMGKDAHALPMFVHSNTMGVIKAASETKTGDESLRKLCSGEFDTTLVVGDDVLANLPSSAAKALAKTQIVYVGPPGGLTDRMAAVSIHTVDTITSGVGTMTRIDMNQITFKKWSVSKEGHSISEALMKLQKHVQEKNA